jgi:hypothetical protein
MVDFTKAQWINEPENYQVESDFVSMTTTPNSDLWQRRHQPGIFGLGNQGHYFARSHLVPAQSPRARLPGRKLLRRRGLPADADIPPMRPG